jgi:hypothetical protein
VTSIWPNGKQFAFTVFDDPDGDSASAQQRVYPFLRDLGFRTTIGVWTIGPLREVNCPGLTCADPEYLRSVKSLQAVGFEIGYHSAAPHSCTRREVIQSLEQFHRYFGHYPVTMANHFNADALYWGKARLTGAARAGLYGILTRGQNADRFCGHVEGSSAFWGDIAAKRIRYCRNFVFTEINTLAVCPQMPYRDPIRVQVPYWYCSTDGNDSQAFLKVVSEANQDNLEGEGGLCIMYTHFGKGFVEDGRLKPRFVELMTRLARKDPWFAPAGTVLDYLRKKRGEHTIKRNELRRLEWKWLMQKARLGTT